MADAKIVLYTNHRCPWAHRAHIALAELKAPYKEEIIDLDTPRTPEYLQVNPRGLVPALSYNGQILTESAIVANFLADTYPSHLLPPSDSADGALHRARLYFFVDTFFTKFRSAYDKAIYAKSQEEADQAAADAAAILPKEIEPLLADANPFFGGSDKLTQAEVLTASFVVRLLTLAEHGLVPSSLVNHIKEKSPNFYKWAKAVAAHPSVTAIYSEEVTVASAKKRLAKLRGQAA